MRIFLLLVVSLLFITCGPKRLDLDEQAFDSLDLAERELVQFDSVYGNYLQWKGTNEDSVTWALYFDKPNRFAIKSFYPNLKFIVPGNINASGQWSETQEKLRLRFYFPPKDWSIYFDSLNNESIKIIDEETVEINKDAELIRIVNTECKKISR